MHITLTILRNRKGLPSLVRASRKGRQSKATLSNRLAKPIKLKKGKIKAFKKDDKFSLLLWKDTNDVTMLSTLYGALIQEVKRIKKGGCIETKQKPSVVCKYNASMEVLV